MINWHKYEGYREVVAYPAEFSDNRFSIQQLSNAVKKAEILYRGWPFIFVDFNREETNVIGDSIVTEVELTHIRGNEYFETWILRQSGLFFHRTLMDEETHPAATEHGKVLGFELTVYHISEAIGSLWHLYSELGVPDDEILTISFTYMGVKDRQLRVVSPNRAGFFGKQICHSSEISLKRSLPLEEWRSSEVDIASEISSEIFQQFQWIEPNLSVIKELAGSLLAKAPS